MPSIIKVDQIQSDTGSIVYPSNVSLGNTSVTNFGSTGVNARLHVDGIINLPDGQALAFGDGTSRPGITGNKATGFLAVNVAGTERARFNNSGTVILQGGSTSATGTGITFPASQNASSDANTLDDYEEGTWTPNVSNSGAGSWSTRGGTYTKIGRLVTCQFNLDGGNSGTAGSTLTLTGLPFTPASYTNTTVGVYGVNDDTSSTAYTGNILINGTTVMFYRGGSSNGNRVSYAGGTLHFYV